MALITALKNKQKHKSTKKQSVSCKTKSYLKGYSEGRDTVPIMP